MDIERLLVSKVVSTGRIEDVLSRNILEEHFADEECQEVFAAILKHVRSYKTPPSMESLKERFPDFEWDHSNDALEFLIDRFAVGVKRRMADHYLEELADICDDQEQVAQIDSHFLDVARDLATAIPSTEVMKFKDGMDARIEEYKKAVKEGRLMGVPFGFPTLDRLTTGMAEYEYISILAFTGVGKSTLGIKIATNVFLQGYTPLIISLEMGAKEILHRIDAMLASIDLQAMHQMKLPKDQLKRWEEYKEEVREHAAEINVIDTIRGCTADNVFAEAARHKPDLVIVDYVQLMRAPGIQNKWAQLEEISRALKDNARTLGIPVLALAQTNREGAKTGGALDNVGGGISIVQDSDVVIAMHQDEDMAADKTMEIGIKKNRKGPLTTFDCVWDHDTLTFREEGVKDKFEAAAKKKPAEVPKTDQKPPKKKRTPPSFNGQKLKGNKKKLKRPSFG